MRLSWYSDAWEDYIYWQKHDKKILKKINDLLKDIARNKYTGIGKPEPLKENLVGWWSRRINDEDRLVYRIDEENCLILQCKGHYDS
ncbi:MAG: Txe/YoeB family addiction module toxin [Deltaproteobacteria bacterium]|jgi:toxin YoeB|nr:Txe/YoeB family addiction module toxin [Deltaproteobacteria bacterium]